MQRPARTVKKTYNLPPELVTRAQRLLAAKTETEAVVRSLTNVITNAEVEKAVLGAAGRLPGYRPLR